MNRDLLSSSSSFSSSSSISLIGRRITPAFAVLLLASIPLIRAAETNDEPQLIQVLQSNASLAEKNAACAHLKRIGTVKCIPALSSLLLDEQLSHFARYALESMPSPEAGSALLKALPAANGEIKVGIINSLAVRREPQAIPALARLLTAPEPGGPASEEIQVAAARAMGQITTPKAAKLLRKHLAKTASTGNQTALRAALADGLLRCANNALDSGKKSQARSLFKSLYENENREHVRVAAFRGMILSSGRDGLNLISDAILKGPEPARLAALQLVHSLDVPGATAALVDLLSKTSSERLGGAYPQIQVGLIRGLAQRNDPAAASAIAKLLPGAPPEVRIAAISALRILGSSSDARLLAEAAASSTGEEQTAAREALAEISRGDVTAALLSELPGAKPAVQAELARALGERGDAAAFPKLLELARHAPDSARKAELQALAQLAGQQQLASMVSLVTDAKEDSARAMAVDALMTTSQRIQSKSGQLNATPIVNGLENGSAAAKVALLPIGSGLVDAGIRQQFRAALKSSDAAVRGAANRALCDTIDPELLPDMVKLGKETSEESIRTLAINGCVRLLTQEEKVKLPNSERVRNLSEFLDLPLTSSQKQLVLSGLAELPDPKALSLAEHLLEDSAVKAEAIRALIKIALALPGSSRDQAIAALKKASEVTADAASAKAATAAIKQLEASGDFITDWQMAGPFRQAGKNYAALFDIAFAPEKTNAQPVDWRPLPASSDTSRPGIMDLLRAIGGEQCVAYARTQVFSEQEQSALLEIGSDDGVKVWLNSELVHANNTARAIKPDSDEVKVRLKAGWNRLLLKVTQNNQGWSFCARLRKPDGEKLEALRVSAQQ